MCAYVYIYMYVFIYILPCSLRKSGFGAERQGQTGGGRSRFQDSSEISFQHGGRPL